VAPEAARPIVLVGLRCAGKTTVGRLLASALGRGFVDTDEALARLFAAEAGEAVRPAGELLATLGEARFRALEECALRRALEDPAASVVATGGGCVERAANRELLRAGATCVYLRASVAELARRLRSDPAPRPALVGTDAADELALLFERRAPLYEQVAAFEVAADEGTPETVCGRIRERLSALDSFD